MQHTLDAFSAACHDILTTDPGPAGRRKVCSLLEEILKDDRFVATYLTDTTPERQILYEDPQLGFCILAHVYHGAKSSPPHDHGPSWAIYGQARGETDMTDWERVSPASDGVPGTARRGASYTLKPGMAHLYDEGDLHSPSRAGPTRLIRIEGVDLSKVRRFSYVAA